MIFTNDIERKLNMEGQRGDKKDFRIHPFTQS